MYPMPKGFFTRLLEAAFMFALAAWLIRTGIGFLRDIWGILVLLAGIAIAVIALYRIWKYKKNQRF